jgi:hypothetical protein
MLRKWGVMLDKIQEFIDWLEDNTDFGNWDNEVKTQVHRKLIALMISDKQEQGKVLYWGIDWASSPADKQKQDK